MPKTTTTSGDAKDGGVLLTSLNTEFGIVPTVTAKANAQEVANTENLVITMRDPISHKSLGKVSPQKAKLQPRLKGKTNGKAKANGKTQAAKAKVARARAEKTQGPRGMVAAILKLASRPKGVSPAELNKLTEWSGAPWKWLFSNPKRNGYCDRWGYKFKAERGDDGVRYFTTKK